VKFFPLQFLGSSKYQNKTDYQKHRYGVSINQHFNIVDKVHNPSYACSTILVIFAFLGFFIPNNQI